MHCCVTFWVTVVISLYWIYIYVVADRQLHTSGSVLMNLLMSGRDVSFGYQLQPDSHDVSRFVDVTEFFFVVCKSHAPILRGGAATSPKFLSSTACAHAVWETKSCMMKLDEGVIFTRPCLPNIFVTNADMWSVLVVANFLSISGMFQPVTAV